MRQYRRTIHIGQDQDLKRSMPRAKNKKPLTFQAKDIWWLKLAIPLSRSKKKRRRVRVKKEHIYCIALLNSNTCSLIAFGKLILYVFYRHLIVMYLTKLYKIINQEIVFYLLFALFNSNCDI